MTDENLSKNFLKDNQKHQVISEHITSSSAQIPKNAESLLQSSGYANHFGIAEPSESFTEPRSHNHSPVSVSRAEKNSPENSPGTGHINAAKSFVDNYKLDSPEAINDDVQNFVYILKEVQNQVISDIAGGTYTERGSGANDFTNS